MTVEQDQGLRLMAQEMAEALSRDGAAAVALMQRFGLLAGLAKNSATHDAAPDRTGRIGIWEPRGAAEPGAYERSAALRAHWPYWADVQTIPAKGEKKRIVLLGESVAYGFFYAPGFTPAQVLERLVSDILGTAVEVVDLARAGLLAAELGALAGGALALEPDLCVIFAGNNWLPGELPPPFSLERSLEAAVLREGGVSAYKELRERKLFEQVETQMRRSFGKLAQAVPVVLMVPDFNLADWPLDPEVDAPWLPAGGNRRWLECRAAARRALSAGEIETARGLAREMLDLDGGTAGSGWVLLADCARRSSGAGDLAAARACREKARDARLWDNDRKGTWTHGKIQEALRLWGAEAGAAVVDVPAVFAAWQHGELPDRRLFLDFCHMSAQGIRVAMAAAAQETARRLDGALPVPTLEELVAQAPAPSPRLEAEACLTAGFFNAHFGQHGEPMAHFFREAARSPEVAGILRESLELQVRRAPFWARAAAARLASSLLTSQLRDRLLATGREFFSAEMLTAMADSLEAEGRPARAFLDELQRGERSLSEIPQDLLAPYNAPSMVDRNVLWEGSYFYRAYSTVSSFPWVCRAPHEVGLVLTCRRTAAVHVPCQVLVNGAPLLVISPGAAWETFRFTASASQVRAGVNWLEIRWSADLPPGEERIAQAAEEIENGRPYSLVPVFAEIHTFTAALRRDSRAREQGAVDDEALVGAGADDAAGSRDLHLEAEQAALRDLGQTDADRHLLARPGGADVGDVDAGADGGPPLAEERLDGGEAGVFHEADHARGREDAFHVRRPHVRSDHIAGLVSQTGAEHVGGHDE
jgi:hypothetical protein